MSSKTLTRMDLADAVYREVGTSRKEAAEVVDATFEEIIKTVGRGETVKLSNFATFSVRSKRARMGRNPKTGEEVPITPRKVLVFKASHNLKDKMNGK
ncbi:MAG: integration host factor subunit alpha [Pseudomonadaceae bacterium]|nr:integration host factor subunit alpha [Pseudomonadaceae bacterium]